MGFEKEQAYYTAHQAEFQEKYMDKRLVITGSFLRGFYDTPKEAIVQAPGHFKPGEFMLHTPADDGKILEIGPSVQVRYEDGRNMPEAGPIVQAASGERRRVTYAGTY
jgi:hypothetical protein